jgi:hypothetical protein
MMRRSEITSMPPGKQMDELCALAMLVEPEVVWIKTDGSGEFNEWPEYSIDIRETQNIVRWMHRARNCLTLSYTSDWKRPGKMMWTADFRIHDGCYACGQTESLAICRAFLVHRYCGKEGKGYGHG